MSYQKFNISTELRNFERGKPTVTLSSLAGAVHGRSGPQPKNAAAYLNRKLREASIRKQFGL